MISFERALKEILHNTDARPAEKTLIENSLGRILKEDIYSEIQMPPFDKAAMDGYALHAQDTRGATVRLKCIGLIQAGESFKKEIRRGECVKIMTGAPLPQNTDAVIMVENTRVSAQNVEILSSVEKGENVCFQGEDIKPGQRVIEKGREISPSDVAIFATVGKKFVKVTGKPRVAILNTGGEIVPVGAKLGKNKIYNSNGPLLTALLKSDGIEPHLSGTVRDNFKELKEAVKKVLNMDMLLVSGGVSMGDYDLVPEVLISLGVKRIFHKVNIKPGKPLFFGIKENTVVFGIPGNPVSNFLTYLVFIRPALYRMAGYKYCGPVFKEGIVEKEFYSKSGRKHFVLAKITKKDNCYYLEPVASHGSADTLALAKAGGFMAMDENLSVIKKNSKIRFITWKTI